jgi:vacuolar-type H+-ATPase subunit E/Vma4
VLPAPSGAAVPADRVAEVAAELAPVFAALADAQAEAAEIRFGAAALAAERRREAATVAERIRAEWQARAETARAEAFAAARSSAEAAGTELVHEAWRDADALRERVESRLADYVEWVVKVALHEAYADTATAIQEA